MKTPARMVLLAMGLAVFFRTGVNAAFILGLPAASPVDGPHATGVVRVAVQALGGGPASGAQVSFVAYGKGYEKATVQTDYSGEATVTLAADPTIYNVTASGPGGGTAHAQTIINPGVTTTFAIALSTDDQWGYYAGGWGWGWRYLVYGGYAHHFHHHGHFLWALLRQRLLQAEHHRAITNAITHNPAVKRQLGGSIKSGSDKSGALPQKSVDHPIVKRLDDKK